MKLVCSFWLHIILAFMAWVRFLRNILFALYSEEQIKQVFIPVSFMLFRLSFSNENTRSIPLLREKGSSCYWNCKCKTCFNIKETNTFRSFSTKKVYKTNHQFNYDSECIVNFYLVRCVVCNKCTVYLLSWKCVAHSSLGQLLTNFA